VRQALAGVRQALRDRRGSGAASPRRQVLHSIAQSQIEKYPDIN
jgi:hypothetical protein